MKRLLFLLFASLLVLSACGGSKVEIKDITQAFKDEGLQVNDEKEMTKDDYGLAPMTAEKGVIFGIEKDANGEYKNARLMKFEKEKDLDQTKKYYDDAGKGSALLYSHTYKSDDGKFLLQMNGEISEKVFDKYKDSLKKVVSENK
ncbi:hypothetical protein JL770_06745 [Staphylococcus pseudintermedius]|nr:hypothetical protein [Staphylococcus pseudintermedius]MCE5778162.1 hypothetical protein [Staphylococcus pseudintermedius]HCT0410166.1 hypothetical protein [Staphylococcus pseudintermedius]